MKNRNARAMVFGEEAERYDRARPSYPNEMVDDLLAWGASRVLDVGCGTGKAGLLFADRGCDVLGVEPDERMATVARRHGLAVEIGRFEDWDPAGRRFDLVVSGQAWHWVDPQLGAAKAAAVLRPPGRLAVFWNNPVYQPEMRRQLNEVYRSNAPDLMEDSSVLGTLGPDRGDLTVAGIVAAGGFRAPEIRRYQHERSYSKAAYLDQLQTHSDHRLVNPERLAALLEAVGEVIEERNGEIRVTYTTTVITAATDSG